MMDFKEITTVVTEPVSLAEARQQLKLSDDDTAEDGLIATWITAAREVAEQYTGRALASRTFEAALDRFPCYEDDYIDLPMPPVTSVTSVKYTDTAGAEQTVDAADYALSTYGDSRRVAPTYGNYWPSTQCIPNAVRIRFVAGYGLDGGPATPRSVKSAILLMVAWLHEHRGDEMDPDDIQPPAAKALLGAVKIWGF